MKEIIEAMENAVMRFSIFMDPQSKKIIWELRKAIAKAKELQLVGSKTVFGK